ncbi:prephenate dehydrogenase/arogenate dehydrogenase family protein [Desulfuromonas sp. AOP6]|uniref:prephenate dehydrogenase n=1 Tax=Desulfuromonas sp. AOP6 TaxID=1566351 RepID=UPI0012DC9150|nr:prephenate dehydrogenase/arogenate dehydrogenase family protein [Desulfuromonas sp. AOP6]
MKDNPVFIPRLAVIGVGLIGGSLALALKEAKVVGEVVGIGRGLANLEKALDLGVVDRIEQDPCVGVADADLVFLATPVCSLEAVAATIAPSMKRGAVLTDGGSVKAEVARSIEPLMPEGVHFVPGHPIAGTEKSGAEAAFATLYQGKRCILTPTDATNPAALNLVRKVWEIAGSEVVLMDVEKHDRILAAISHLPHMVAYSLVNSVSSYDRYPENILVYSAGGFRDFTRIASSDPTMWRDIAMTNKDALVEMMENFEACFAELKKDVRDGDGEKLFEFFMRSKKSRDAIL